MSAEQVIHTISFGLQREKGPVRQENQDQIAHFQSSVFGHVFVVADGMGGHEGGGIAANMAITGFKQHFQSVSLRMSLRESIAEAARLTNLDIFDTSNENGDLANPLRMGSTLVLCVVAGNFCTVASAGDSRCYSFRNGELRRLTRDHTAVQKMVDSGMISADEAKIHPDASVLTRAFGQRPDLEIDIYDPLELAPDEKLLLCSDGLHGYVDEAAIAEVLHRNADPQAAADALLQLALDAGGQDNISIFVIRVDPATRREGTAPDPPLEALTNGAHAAATSAPVTAAVSPPLAADAEAVRPPSPATDTPPRPAKPAPAQSKSGRRVALTLMILALAIVAGAVVAVVRPEFLPAAVRDWLSTVHPPAAIRDRLAAWGIGQEDSSQVQQVRVAEAETASKNAAAPAPDKKADQPVETATQSDSAADAPPSAAAPTTLEPKPVVAAPPIGQAPAGQAVTASSVSIAIPPGTSDGFRGGIAAFQDRIRAAGFNPVHIEIPVQPGTVWRFIAANPASFAPPETVISAVFLPGFESEAVRICGIVKCTGPKPREVSPPNLKLYQSAFAGSSVALLIHPKAAGPESSPAVAAPPPHPNAERKE